MNSTPVQHNNEVSNYKQLIKKIEEYKQLGNQEFSKYDKTNDNLNKRAITYYSLGIECFNNNFEILKNNNINNNENEEEEKELKKLVSIIYSNLSLCFINGYEIDKALEFAIKGIEIDSYNSKCHYRKSLCNQYMCNFKESFKSINDALDSINNNNNNKVIDKSLKHIIENERKEIEKKLKKLEKEEKECKDRIKEDFEQFQQFPIELVWREGFGRCVLASEDLPKGTMVLRVSPFASVLEDHKIEKNCGFCFKKINKSDRINQTCKICKNHLLCSQCSKDQYAKDYHKEECDILNFLKEYYPSSQTRDFRFMFRVLLNVIKDKNFKKSQSLSSYSSSSSSSSSFSSSSSSSSFKSFSKENQSKQWLNHENPFIFDSYKYLINLSRTLDKVQPEQMEAFKRSAQSVITIFNKLRGPKFFDECGVTIDEIIEIYSIVLSNGHEMLHPLNCHTYGLGIFPTGSYLNHSCLPNAFWYNDDQGMMVFRTLRSIKKGEEILTSYTDITTECSERRKHLLKQYFFFCQCQQCKFQSQLTDQSCSSCKNQLLNSTIHYKLSNTNNNNNNNYNINNLIDGSGFNYKCLKCNTINKQLESINPSSYFTNQHDQRTFKKINLLINIMQQRHQSIATNIINTNNEYLMKGMPDHIVYKEITNALEQSMILNPSKVSADQVFTNSLIQYYFRLFQTLKLEKPNDTHQLQSIKTKILQLLTPIIHLPSSHHKTSIEKKLKF
ncbi:hypothetical protein ACTA71_010732 [Dictyostelium dimigraforme]